MASPSAPHAASLLRPAFWGLPWLPFSGRRQSGHRCLQNGRKPGLPSVLSLLSRELLPRLQAQQQLGPPFNTPKEPQSSPSISQATSHEASSQTWVPKVAIDPALQLRKLSLTVDTQPGHDFCLMSSFKAFCSVLFCFCPGSMTAQLTVGEMRSLQRMGRPFLKIS